MGTSTHFQRGQVLLSQRRWDMAEQELRLALVEEPNDAFTHALLGICLCERERFDEARQEAELAVHLAPEHPYPHYVLSVVRFRQNHFPEAEQAIREAVRLDPVDADYFGWLAQVCFAQRRWQDALQAAETGLALDGEHTLCVNLRAMALVKLGQKQDASLAIAAALERNPEDAHSHANMGWTLLEQRQPQKALEHFREALRIAPDFEWARQGILEAMKARYLFYRIMLMYFLWMMKLSRQAQWFLLIGGYLGYRFLRSVARQNPELAPWLMPFIVGYIAFAVMTWLASPLFNLLLRFNRFGRLVLSREETRTSTWVGASLLIAVVMVACYFCFDIWYMLFAAVMFGLMSFPLSRIYDCDERWPRKTLIACTAGMGLLALLSVTLMALSEHLLTGKVGPFVGGLGVIGFYSFAVIAFFMQFAINALVSAVPRR